jgi:acyl-CoA thioesterase-2
MDRWLLIAQESPSAAGARGFGTGHAYAAAGDLVASFAQESLIRQL